MKDTLSTCNSSLNQIECLSGRSFLDSMPSYMTIVLGNGCNIDCPHCYQLKNGDNLLRNAQVGAKLRREFMQMYPYLETLRIQGGEVFALKGFRELIDDVKSIVDKPIVSISTNGMLMNEQWCQEMVSIPFQSITVSFDAGTKKTFETVRRGAKFDTVIENVTRIQKLKKKSSSQLPKLDSFYVVMRSNFREIEDFLKLMVSLEIFEVAFQTVLVDDRNLAREPSLKQEPISEAEEVIELHEILKRALKKYRHLFERINFSGFKSMFDQFDLDSSFLEEEEESLIPRKNTNTEKDVKNDELALSTSNAECRKPIKELPKPTVCINPWTTIFITENGDVSLCFLSDPVGNLYETPLIEIWNSSSAIAKRSRMLAGRYISSGCSKLWCDWREGTESQAVDDASDWSKKRREFKSLVSQLKSDKELEKNDVDQNLKAVRRMIGERNARIKELEANLHLLWDENVHLHDNGQKIIDNLSAELADIKNKSTFYRIAQKCWQVLNRN